MAVGRYAWVAVRVAVRVAVMIGRLKKDGMWMGRMFVGRRTLSSGILAVRIIPGGRVVSSTIRGVASIMPGRRKTPACRPMMITMMRMGSLVVVIIMLIHRVQRIPWMLSTPRHLSLHTPPLRHATPALPHRNSLAPNLPATGTTANAAPPIVVRAAPTRQHRLMHRRAVVLPCCGVVACVGNRGTWNSWRVVERLVYAT